MNRRDLLKAVPGLAAVRLPVRSVERLTLAPDEALVVIPESGNMHPEQIRCIREGLMKIFQGRRIVVFGEPVRLEKVKA